MEQFTKRLTNDENFVGILRKLYISCLTASDDFNLTSKQVPISLLNCITDQFPIQCSLAVETRSLCLRPTALLSLASLVSPQNKLTCMNELMSGWGFPLNTCNDNHVKFVSTCTLMKAGLANNTHVDRNALRERVSGVDNCPQTQFQEFIECWGQLESIQKRVIHASLKKTEDLGEPTTNCLENRKQTNGSSSHGKLRINWNNFMRRVLL